MIHHATRAKAEKLGIILTEIDGTVEALWPSLNRRISNPDPKVAVRLGELLIRFGHEYPGVHVELMEGSTDTYSIICNGETVHEFGSNFDVDEIFAETLELIEDLGVMDIAEGASYVGYAVVPARYKAEYAARGNRDHCGDWLAKFMDGKFQKVVDGEFRFDPDAFEAFLRENDVSLSGKWAALRYSEARGSIGRWRMNGRQKLEKEIAISGLLVYKGEKVEIPAEALEEIRAKHPKHSAQ